MQASEYRLGCPLMVLIWLVSLPLAALAISLTWNWFIVPATNFPQIGLGAAIGIRVFLFAVFNNDVEQTSEMRERFAAMSMASVLWKTAEKYISPPIMALFVAWAWHSVMMS